MIWKSCLLLAFNTVVKRDMYGHALAILIGSGDHQEGDYPSATVTLEVPRQITPDGNNVIAKLMIAATEAGSIVLGSLLGCHSRAHCGRPTLHHCDTNCGPQYVRSMLQGSLAITAIYADGNTTGRAPEQGALTGHLAGWGGAVTPASVNCPPTSFSYCSYENGTVRSRVRDYTLRFFTSSSFTLLLTAPLPTSPSSTDPSKSAPSSRDRPRANDTSITGRILF